MTAGEQAVLSTALALIALFLLVGAAIVAVSWVVRLYGRQVRDRAVEPCAVADLPPAQPTPRVVQTWEDWRDFCQHGPNGVVTWRRTRAADTAPADAGPTCDSGL